MKVFVLALLIFLLAVLVSPGWGQEAGEYVQVSADSQEFVEDANTVLATGNARIVFRDLILAANKVSADLNSNMVTAEGAVTVTQGDRVLHGDSATYNIETKLGKLMKARTLIGQIIGTGDQISALSNDAIELLRANITTCDLAHPCYHITARRMLLYPGRQIKAEGVSVYLYKYRLFSAPRLKKSLTRGEATAVVPRLGFSKMFGVYLSQDYPIDLLNGTTGVIDARISQKHLIHGGVKLDQVMGSRGFLWATYLEEVRGLKNTRILLDRLPYAGFGWGPLLFGNKKAFTFDGNINTGYFRERPSGVNAIRAAGEGKIAFRQIMLGKNMRLDIGTELFTAAYATGNSYSYIRPGVNLSVEPALGFHGGIGFSDYLDRGKTPFLFDGIEVPREVTPRLGFNAPTWGVSTEWRYDLLHRQLFDALFSYTRRMHCIEPRIFYSVRRGEIGFDINIPALSQGLLGKAQKQSSLAK